jgi:hypothetical protein
LKPDISKNLIFFISGTNLAVGRMAGKFNAHGCWSRDALVPITSGARARRLHALDFGTAPASLWVTPFA